MAINITGRESECMSTSGEFCAYRTYFRIVELPADYRCVLETPESLANGTPESADTDFDSSSVGVRPVHEADSAFSGARLRAEHPGFLLVAAVTGGSVSAVCQLSLSASTAEV